jgi:hypothetical protein
MVAHSGTCIRSPNYPQPYDADGRCTFTVSAHEAVMLSVTAFETEERYDWLEVNGVQYSGTSGPENVQVPEGGTVTFFSDDSESRSGFEICGSSTPFPVRERESSDIPYLTPLR